MLRAPMPGPIWQPSPERASQTQLAGFHGAVSRSHGVAADYAALHAWSCGEPEAFWPALWDFLGIVGDRGARVLERGPTMADARFFPDARLSFAENLLARRDDATAIVSYAADGSRRTLTFRELAGQVASVAAGLRDLGVVAGDRVAGVLPSGPEAVVAMLAANSIGAIWSLCDHDAGLDAVADRLGQIAPVVVFASSSPRTAALVDRLPSVRHAVIVSDPAAPGPVDSRGTARWIDHARLAAGHAGEPRFERVAFDAPAFVLYTSGTTGLPKCIVHGTGGMLVQLLKEHRLHYDLRRDDRFFYQTSTGWNMWYWVVIALAAGATIVLRAGSPVRPRADSLFELADAERLTHLGVSPAYLAQIRAAGVKPQSSHRLADLRTVLSTGSPLSAGLFDYVYDAIKSDVCLSSISGGTEINACFVTGNPTAAVFRGEIQAPALGMQVEVFDDDGRAIQLAKGELVCTAPFPSQPVGFWADPERRHYLATYFERFPGVWHHGDFAETTPNGGFIIHGRSDAVLKPGGHRIGTAELYRQIEPIDEIEDSVAIGQSWRDDVRIVLFVVLRDGAVLDEALERRIRGAILTGTSPHHVPARIVAVPAIPYTRTGKKAEIAARAAVHGEPVAGAASLANPEALEHYRGLPPLRR
jgi:acetoacetyl-CoA synthetase